MCTPFFLLRWSGQGAQRGAGVSCVRPSSLFADLIVLRFMGMTGGQIFHNMMLEHDVGVSAGFAAVSAILCLFQFRPCSGGLGRARLARCRNMRPSSCLRNLFFSCLCDFPLFESRDLAILSYSPRVHDYQAAHRAVVSVHNPLADSSTHMHISAPTSTQKKAHTHKHIPCVMTGPARVWVRGWGDPARVRCDIQQQGV